MTRKPSPNVEWTRPTEALGLFLRGHTTRTALPTALIVGSVLSAINQGAILAADRATSATWIRIAANYLIPFVVASIGYLSARRVRTPEGSSGER